MAEVHHHGHASTTVLEDREGPATALLVVLGLALVGLLVWFFGFSGIVFDRSGTTGGTNVTTNVEDGSNTGGGSTTIESSTPAPATT